MNLRARLILAFLGLSILPLTAVTLYSYRSSTDAMRRIAESEAHATAWSLTARMDSLTKDIGQRIEQICELPPPSPAQVKVPRVALDSKQAADSVTALLGKAADVVDRLEFVASESAPPVPPPSAGRRAVDGEPRVPPVPAVPGAPVRADRIVIDVSGLARSLGATDVNGLQREEALTQQAAALRFIQHMVSLSLKAGATETARALEQQAAAMKAERGASRPRPGVLGGPPGPPSGERSLLKVTAPSWKGEALGVPVTREGRVIGTVNAKLNLDRALADVLSAARREEGEIPFAIDPTLKIHTPRPADRARLKALDPAALAGTEQAFRHAGPGADWIVVTRRDPSGTTFGIARPLGEPLRDIRMAAGRNLAIGLSLIGLSLVGIIPLSGRVTRNLGTLTDGARRLATGDLKVRVPVRSRDEFGELARAFNQMAGDLEAKQKALVVQERLQRELELCRLIQNEMLPHAPLVLDVAEVRGVSIPAREVGGDFFNYFVVDDGQLALLVGDVAGKGVGAALLMANIQATLRARLPLERDLAKLVDAIDREMERSMPRPVYLTLFVGILDTRLKTLRYVNAGHNPQFILRAGGGADRLPSTGLPVGMFAGHGYEERAVELADGDLLFFYTDGMVEVENEAGEFFDTEQLEALLVAEHRDDVDTLLVRVEDAVRAFRGTAEALDDATMMALRFGSRRSYCETRPTC